MLIMYNLNIIIKPNLNLFNLNIKRCSQKYLSFI